MPPPRQSGAASSRGGGAVARPRCNWLTHGRWGYGDGVRPFVLPIARQQGVELEGVTVFLEAIEEQDDVTLTEADRAYLKALETWLDMCPEMRTTE